MKPNSLVVTASLLLLATVAGAQDRPYRPAPEEAERRAMWRERYMRWREEEQARWDSAAELMREHAPRRWAAYEALSETQQMRVRPSILRRYGAIQQIREHSSEEVYALVVRRVELEDQAWDLGRQIREASDDTTRQTLVAELEKVVTEMVQVQFDERTQRLDNLKRAVAREEARLAEDKQRVEELISLQVRKMISEQDPLMNPDAPAPDRPGRGERGPRLEGEGGPPGGEIHPERQRRQEQRMGEEGRRGPDRPGEPRRRPMPPPEGQN